MKLEDKYIIESNQLDFQSHSVQEISTMLEIITQVIKHKKYIDSNIVSYTRGMI